MRYVQHLSPLYSFLVRSRFHGIITALATITGKDRKFTLLNVRCARPSGDRVVGDPVPRTPRISVDALIRRLIKHFNSPLDYNSRELLSEHWSGRNPLTCNPRVAVTRSGRSADEQVLRRPRLSYPSKQFSAVASYSRLDPRRRRDYQETRRCARKTENPSRATVRIQTIATGKSRVGGRMRGEEPPAEDSGVRAEHTCCEAGESRFRASPSSAAVAGHALPARVPAKINDFSENPRRGSVLEL